LEMTPEKVTERKPETDLKESNTNAGKSKVDDFEQLNVAVTAQIHEVQEQFRTAQRIPKSNFKDAKAYFAHLVEFKKDTKTFEDMVEPIMALSKGDGNFEEKFRSIISNLENSWKQTLTDKVRANLTPIVQHCVKVGKASKFEYDYKEAFGDAAGIDDSAILTENEPAEKLTPETFFNLVHPYWDQQMQELQAKVSQYEEKEDYESAQGIADEMDMLLPPEDVKGMLEISGTTEDVLSVCDELVASLRKRDESGTAGLERAYKRMRTA